MNSASGVDKIRLRAVADTILYLPLTLAIRTGLFRAEGLDVELHVPGPGPRSANAVLGGQAEVALGGIWHPAMNLALQKRLVAFAAIARRCPMFLLSNPEFAASGWKGLEGRRVILCGDAVSQWVVFRMLCEANHVDISKVRLLPDFQPEEGAEFFAAGISDYIYIGQPSAEELILSDKAHLLVRFAEAAGPLPWSVFMATPKFLSERRDCASRFVRALQNSLKQISDQKPAQLAEAAHAAFSSTSASTLEQVIARYKQLGAWPETTRIESADLASWERMLIAHGVLSPPVDWPSIVDNSFAEAAATKVVRGSA